MTPNDNQSAHTTAAAEPVLSEGQRLAGCYILCRPVETIGSPVVWLAHDEVLGRDISLHFLPSAVRSDARAMEEIRKEVKRNRQLIHPNILRVHDLIEEADFAAVAMDSFNGESLALLLKKQGILAPGAVQPWIGQLCQTLEDAHKVNLTHRDLAPSNLFLGEDGKILIAGFGTSRSVQDALGRVARGSSPRLAYQSPQLADGQAATPSDDVYSLGILLFELLTGELPFNGGDVVSQTRRVAAPRVSARLAANRRVSTVPVSWDETIASALRKDASQRPISASDVLVRLEPVPVTALPLVEAAGPAQKPAEATRRPEPAKTPSQVTAPAAPAKASEPAAANIEARKVEAPKLPANTAPLTAEVKKDAAAGSEPPAKKAVDILRERAAELKRNQSASGVSATPLPAVTVTAEAEPARKDSKVTPPPAPPFIKTKAGNVTEIYPNLQPQRSRLPALGLAAGVALAAVGLAGYFLSEPNEEAEVGDQGPGIATTQESYASEIRSVNNKGEYPSSGAEPVAAAPAAESAPLAVAKPAPAPEAAAPRTAAPAPSAKITPPAPEPAPLVAPPVAALTPAVPVATAPRQEILLAARKPTTPPPAPVPTAPVAAPTEAAVAEKLAAVEKLKQAAQAAEQAQQDLQRQQQQAESATAEIQKALEQKTKELVPLRKAADDLAKARKTKEEAQKTAELDAQRAQQVAAEKTRLAEEARKALADLEADNKTRLTAQEKADAELLTLQKTLAEKQQAAAAVMKAITASDTARQQSQAAFKQAELDAEQTKMAAAKAIAAEAARIAREEGEKLRAEKAKEREKIESEIAAMKKMFDEKMKVLEDAQKAISDAEAKTKDTGAIQKKAEEDALKALSKPAAPSGGKAMPPEKAPALEKPMATQKLVPADAPPAPATASAPAPVADTTLAMKTDPTKPEAKPAPEKPAQGDGLTQNSLGMKFAPVGDVQFSIWQTRVQDFEAFAGAVNLRSTAWKGPGFKQAPNHPVVNVTWQEAIAFCKWLSDKEHKDGALPANTIYRLPTDLEWSVAVGLVEESGKNPEARDMGVPDVYPWGNQWPPPAGAGNYTGEETGSDVAIKGYDDGFAWTSPVGSFPPNKYGIYDMGGNVWQWVMDAWNNESKHKVLRGASWYNGALKLSLLSSCRVHAAPDSSTDNYGFRIVRSSDAAKTGRR